MSPVYFYLASRLAAGIAGGYALAAAFSVWLSFILPMPRADAVLTGLLASFAIYAAAILWAFAARSLWRLWFGLLVPAAACAVFAWLAGPITAS